MLGKRSECIIIAPYILTILFAFSCSITSIYRAVSVKFPLHCSFVINRYLQIQSHIPVAIYILQYMVLPILATTAICAARGLTKTSRSAAKALFLILLPHSRHSSYSGIYIYILFTNPRKVPLNFLCLCVRSNGFVLRAQKSTQKMIKDGKNIEVLCKLFTVHVIILFLCVVFRDGRRGKFE